MDWKDRLAALLLDVIALAGAALVTFGAWGIYRPLGFIVSGAFLLTGAILFSARTP